MSPENRETQSSRIPVNFNGYLDIIADQGRLVWVGSGTSSNLAPFLLTLLSYLLQSTWLTLMVFMQSESEKMVRIRLFLCMQLSFRYAICCPLLLILEQHYHSQITIIDEVPVSIVAYVSRLNNNIGRLSKSVVVEEEKNHIQKDLVSWY